MLKSVLSSIYRVSAKKVSQSPSARRQWLQEVTLSENRSAGFNPRKARNKSVKGITILHK